MSDATKIALRVESIGGSSIEFGRTESDDIGGTHQSLPWIRVNGADAMSIDPATCDEIAVWLTALARDYREWQRSRVPAPQSKRRES